MRTIALARAAVAVAVAALASPSGAHHSVAGVYDSSRPVTIEAVVAAFHFVNPHPFLTASVDAGDGPTAWRLEMDNRSELEAIGVRTDTFRAGDRIVVTGSLARRQAHALYVRTLDRPADRLRYEQVGGSPRLRPGSDSNLRR
jgi:hypothetical protein